MAEEHLIEQIRQRAYEIWLGEGRPHGRDRMHWLRAEGEFREKVGGAQSDASPSKAPVAAGGKVRAGKRKQGATAGDR